jgi:hypothetical protein
MKSLLASLPILLLVLACSVRTKADAQLPVESIRREEDTIGQTSGRVTLEYTPWGADGYGLDEKGQHYAFASLTQEWTWKLVGSIVLDLGWKAGFEVTHQVAWTDELRQYGAVEAQSRSSQRQSSYSLQQEFKMDQYSPWNPRARIALGHPWQAAMGLTASRLLDPMVFAGEMTFRVQEHQPQQWFSLSLGLGFVANRWISLIGTANLSVPLSSVGLPMSSFGFRMLYRFDLEARREFGVRTSVTFTGDSARVTIGIDISGRKTK